MTEDERQLWNKVSIRELNECWPWLGRTNGNGYGKIGNRYVHRLAYELSSRTTIPLGFHIHHKCGNKSCCNPDHLEAITVEEHCARSVISPAAVNGRKLFCKRGHEFTKENTYRGKDGSRRCRKCGAAHWRKKHPRWEAWR